MSPRRDVSVVMPCFKAAPVALESVDELRQFFVRAGIDRWEVIVVDDGGGDFPATAWDDDDSVRLIRLPRNVGKGAAVREGIKASVGHVRVITDVDVPYGPNAIGVIYRHVVYGQFHAVFGDRRLPSSFYTQAGPVRRALSGLCSSFVGTLVTGGFFDTQCGLKGFRGDMADLLFPLSAIDRFAFDVEIVYLALRHNLAIRRIPVTRERSAGHSTVRPIRDALLSTRDILQIKGRAMAGHYECAPLERLVHEEFQRQAEWSERGLPQAEQT